MFSHVSISQAPTDFALPGIKALTESLHIFWSMVAHPDFYLFGGSQGLLQTRLGELFHSSSKSPSWIADLQLVLQVFLVYSGEAMSLPRQHMALVQQGHSKGTQLQGICGVTVVQHSWLHTCRSIGQ